MLRVGLKDGGMTTNRYYPHPQAHLYRESEIEMLLYLSTRTRPEVEKDSWVFLRLCISAAASAVCYKCCQEMLS